MGLENKLEDIHLGLKVPLCECCVHVRHHVRSAQHPEQPSMTCSELGSIPEELHTCRVYVCDSFEVDQGSYQAFRPFLPSDVTVE